MYHMRGIKTTIYLPEDLKRDVKKHLIDTGETLSKFTEIALRTQLKYDNTRAGKKRLKEKRQLDQISDVIRNLAESD